MRSYWYLVWFPKLLLTFLPFLFSVAIQAQELKIGAAKRILTPNLLIAVSGGVGTPKPASLKKGDLSVRAIVFVKGNEKIAIVNIDNLGWPRALGDKSRKLIEDIPFNNILIGATHTHSAPDAYAFPNETSKHGADIEYLDWCVVQIADAVNEALLKSEPSNLKIAVGDAQGKIAYNYYATDLYDARCGVIQAVGIQGENKDKPIATLINYAIHPEVIGNDRGILSPDLVGPLYGRIEEKEGGIALFMNSALGGMITADTRLGNGKEATDWDECKRIGNLLADEALRIIKDAPLQTNPTLYCTNSKVTFPIESDMMKFILENSPLTKESSQRDSINTTLNLLNIGSAQILTIPGEALPNISYYLKRKMPTIYPFLFGLTNDALEYILTKEDYSSFKRYDLVSRTSLGESTGEILVSTLLDLIKNNPKPDN